MITLAISRHRRRSPQDSGRLCQHVWEWTTSREGFQVWLKHGSIKADIAKGAKLSANKEMPPAYQAIDWTTAWKKGDAKNWCRYLQEDDASRVTIPASGRRHVIGPSLAGVAKRFRPQYLAQSVAAPSKDVSPNFQTWAIVQDNGKVLLGFLSGEDENRVTLQMMDGSLKAVEKSTNRRERHPARRR